MKFIGSEDELELMGIYKITNLINKKVYVGSSVKFKKRFYSHTSKLIKDSHENYYLQEDFNKYGQDNFTIEIVKLIDNKYNLPNEEKSEIEKHKQLYGVYNISDPTEEFIKGRFEKKKVYKGSSDGKRYKISKKNIILWLNENYGDKMKVLHNHIEERKFYVKETVDEWFLNNITNKEILEDERISGILNAWYNKNGFVIVDSRMYKSIIKKLFNKDVEFDVLLLVTPIMSRDLHNAKFRKARQQKPIKN